MLTTKAKLPKIKLTVRVKERIIDRCLFLSSLKSMSLSNQKCVGYVKYQMPTMQLKASLKVETSRGFGPWQPGVVGGTGGV